MDYKDFGQRVRLARKERGMTQEQLSEQLNISPSFLGHIERGTRVPSLDTLTNLCNVLCMPPSFFMHSGLAKEFPMPRGLSEEDQTKMSILANCVYELWLK